MARKFKQAKRKLDQAPKESEKGQSSDDLEDSGEFEFSFGNVGTQSESDVDDSDGEQEDTTEEESDSEEEWETDEENGGLGESSDDRKRKTAITESYTQIHKKSQPTNNTPTTKKTSKRIQKKTVISRANGQATNQKHAAQKSRSSKKPMVTMPTATSSDDDESTNENRASPQSSRSGKNPTASRSQQHRSISGKKPTATSSSAADTDEDESAHESRESQQSTSTKIPIPSRESLQSGSRKTLTSSRKSPKTESSKTSISSKKSVQPGSSKPPSSGTESLQTGSNEAPTSAYDEYAEYDTSDEEDIRNTVGNVPMNWYDDLKHLGYDWYGDKIGKPEITDRLDDFIKRMEDPDYFRTVTDPQTGKKVVLSDEDIEVIKRLGNMKIPNAEHDEYAPWVEWFTSDVMKVPLRNFPEHKRSFLPSRHEQKKISEYVHKLKMGLIKTRAELEEQRRKKEPQFGNLWTTDEPEYVRRIHNHIPAPKRPLPGHAEAYNPPPEYLFDAKELKQWRKQKDTPQKRKLHFVPKKYDCLRKVPAYERYYKERFLRCLDLYLCPRGIRMRLQIQPEDLVPKLPPIKDLQPFPQVLTAQYSGHTDMVRTMSCDKYGEYLVSGSDDGTVKIWDNFCLHRCVKTIQTGGVVRSVEWCPNDSMSLILVATDNRVILINPGLSSYPHVVHKTDDLFKDAPQTEEVVPNRVKTAVQWSQPEGEDYHQKGYRLVLTHFKEVTQVTWHGCGDYFASVMRDGLNRSVLVHRISTRQSQIPFTKSQGIVQHVLFHPIRPHLFVATQMHVRIYDLTNRENPKLKTLRSNSKQISSMAIHPGGDNLLVGTHDRKVLWFDLDFRRTPYQTLRLHGTSVRSVAFHKRYPLFVSGSDDKALLVCHGQIYNDLNKMATIVPLRRFQDHETNNDFGIFGVLFHPTQPWVFTCGADGTIKLYTN